MRLDGWLRIAIVFTAVWFVIVVGIAAYERLTTGPWDYYSKNAGLWFFAWARDLLSEKENLGLVFNGRRFWNVLLLPISVVWAFAAILVPSIRWIRRGFHI